MSSCSQNTPEAAARKFLEGFHHMEYDKARQVSTEETKNMIDIFEQFAVARPDSVKKEARDIKIEILDVQEDGDKAVVVYKTSEEPTEQKLDMVKTNGKWLASFSKQDSVDEDEEGEEQAEAEE